MKQEALKYFRYLELSGLSTFIFISVFVGITIWTYLKVNKDQFEYLSRLPLDEEDQHE